MLVALVGYLMGSVPFAFLAARVTAGVDIRRAGSGNVGAANVLRVTNVSTALLTLALDAGKGAAAVLIARRMDPSALAAAIAGVAAIVGHVYPVWLGFRGGKGVATSCGVFGVLAPYATAAAIVVFVGIVWWTRYVSLGSVVASATLAFAALLTHAPMPTVVAAACAALLVIQGHRDNASRLVAGREPRVGQGS
jgi:acyl phosphate:glycerol-3-phosphate acyltransferase